jgi:hypothetical protein
MFDSFEAACLWWRRHCGWVLETAESARTCPSPASGTSFSLLMFNKMAPPEEASPSEVITGVKPNHWNTNIHRVRRRLGDSVRSDQPPGPHGPQKPFAPEGSRYHSLGSR